MEQDLAQLAVRLAEETTSDFPGCWNPDWGDPPQTPDEAARLLYEALDGWGQTSWSDRHFDDPLEPGNDVFGHVCALERLVTSEGKRPVSRTRPARTGLKWSAFLGSRTGASPSRFGWSNFAAKCSTGLCATFPNAFADRPQVSSVDELRKAIQNGHRQIEVDGSENKAAWELLVQRMWKRSGEVSVKAFNYLAGEVREKHGMLPWQVDRLTLSEFWGLVESNRAEPPKVADTDQQDERTEAEGGRKPKPDGPKQPAENWWFVSPPSEGSEFDGNGPVKSTLKKMAEWLNEDPRIVKGHNGKSLWIQKLHARQYAFWFASKKQYAEVNQKSLAESARNSAKQREMT